MWLDEIFGCDACIDPVVSVTLSIPELAPLALNTGISVQFAWSYTIQACPSNLRRHVVQTIGWRWACSVFLSRKDGLQYFSSRCKVARMGRSDRRCAATEDSEHASPTKV
jgi:hypothetical protein